MRSRTGRRRRPQQVRDEGRAGLTPGAGGFSALLPGLRPESREEYGDDVDWAEEAEEAQAEEEMGGPEESGRRMPLGTSLSVVFAARLGPVFGGRQVTRAGV
ncbi:hypothetical protein [Streptomyces sp. RFCAC02]|uniref:hypothetical protein n=1 Tax=Streptomyces sp. RFCAC02 TaxID=2499143 RepID=UPI0010212A06|nr:hypothetical protein [Streptomyces sp. RFCAC02]